MSSNYAPTSPTLYTQPHRMLKQLEEREYTPAPTARSWVVHAWSRYVECRADVSAIQLHGTSSQFLRMRYNVYQRYDDTPLQHRIACYVVNVDT